ARKFPSTGRASRRRRSPPGVYSDRPERHHCRAAYCRRRTRKRSWGFCSSWRDLVHPSRSDASPPYRTTGRIQLRPFLSRNAPHSMWPLNRSKDVKRGTGPKMALLALTIADRGYVLESGKVVRDDSAAALAGDPAIEAAYLGRVEAAQ